MSNKTFKENVLRVVAVLGLIAVLLLGAWGIIQLAFAIPSFFGGLGARQEAKESLSLSAPLSVQSGSAFPIGWTHKNFSGEYSYKLSYSCVDGVSMLGYLPNGQTQEVACNTPFNYVNAASSTGLVPLLSGSTNKAVTLKVEATKLSTGATTASATQNTTVAPSTKTTITKPSTSGSASTGSTTKKPASSTTKTNYVAAARPAQLYGYSDLAVRITSNPGVVYAGQQVALQFVVENRGTNKTPENWSFVASLPYNPVYQYSSVGQQALYPGDKIVYTLSYTADYSNNVTPCNGWSFPCTQPYTIPGGPGTCNAYGPCLVPGYPQNQYGYTYNLGGQQSASVSVDPYNYVWESDENNNSASISYQIY